MENTIDSLIEEDAGQSEKSTLELLTDLSNQQIQKEQELKVLKEMIAKKEEEYKDLANRQIPKVMSDLGMGEFTLKTGEKISIKKSYFGSIKDNEQQFFAYLEKHDFGDLIKNFVKVSFEKEEFFKANELVENLSRMGYNVDQDKNVNANTLKSFIKERMEALEQLREAYIDSGKIPCKEGDEGWEDYLAFAIERDQEADLMFPKDLCKVIVVEQTKITPPKKKK